MVRVCGVTGPQGHKRYDTPRTRVACRDHHEAWTMSRVCVLVGNDLCMTRWLKLEPGSIPNSCCHDTGVPSIRVPRVRILVWRWGPIYDVVYYESIKWELKIRCIYVRLYVSLGNRTEWRDTNLFWVPIKSRTTSVGVMKDYKLKLRKLHVSYIYTFNDCLLIYESMKRKLLKPIYECRCNGRLQTKRFTRLAHTGSVVELEHLKIKTRLETRSLRVWYFVCLLWNDEAKANIKPIYECRCNGRLQTQRSTRLSHTGLVVELEDLKIKTRLTNEKFASVKGECEI
jgi:hypothetical protein